MQGKSEIELKQKLCFYSTVNAGIEMHTMQLRNKSLGEITCLQIQVQNFYFSWKKLFVCNPRNSYISAGNMILQ